MIEYKYFLKLKNYKQNYKTQKSAIEIIKLTNAQNIFYTFLILNCIALEINSKPTAKILNKK
jgi:hypothetical protein